MAIRKPIYPTIKKPTKRMLEEAGKVRRAKEDMNKYKLLGPRHILELESERAMYKHAMNLSEEMWKHYNYRLRSAKRPSKQLIAAEEKASIDFQYFSIKYENLDKYLKKRAKI